MSDKGEQIVKLFLERKHNSSQIAKIVRCTKQYVSRVLKEKKLIKPIVCPPGYMMPTEAAKQLGYVNYAAVLRAISYGKINTVNIGGRLFVLKSAPYARKCIICGKPVPKRRIKLCSKQCLIVRQRRLHSNIIWRNLYRMKGQRIEGSSVDYIRKPKTS